MIKKTAILVFVLALISGISFATPVDSVTMTHTGYGAKGTLRLWGGGHSGLNVYAGLFQFEKTAGTGAGELFDNGIISGFCMDLSQSVARGSAVYELIDPQDGPRPTTFLGGGMGDAKAGYLSELWGRYYDSSWATAGSYNSQQKREAEAFAASIWEIIYEDLPASGSGWDVSSDGTSGNLGFKATGLDFGLANSWLASLDGTGPMAQLGALSNNYGQDFIVVVPEPATVALFGLVGLFLTRKRK